MPPAGIIPKAIILLAFAIVLGVPWAFRPPAAVPPADAERLVIITPHNEQIRTEFASGFDRWHREHFGRPVVIDWRVPGGTTEIRRLLVAQYTAALASGRLTPAGELRTGDAPMPYDLLFGGGSFEHGEVKRGVRARPPGMTEEVSLPVSVPMGFTTDQLEEWFGPGEHKVGISPLYDADQYWIGNAVSGFGIVFNRDVLRELGLPEPTSWDALTDPALAGWVALADPRQSGSVATAYESILYSMGWERGWRTLRAMGANARYYSNSSPKVPIDVSQGQAAVGIAIDFYGRYQSHAVMRPGETPETSRVGYIDPPGQTMIDPDPISLLRAGPNPTVARRFVEYLLSVEGQSIWNFPPASHHSAPGTQHLGPDRFALRRLPIRRVMFAEHMDSLMDKVDPYAIASQAPNRGWRSAVGLMMGAFSIDIHHEQRLAWGAIERARRRGESPDRLAEMERLFFAWPEHRCADGRELPFDESNYAAIRADWRDAENTGRMTRVRLEYTAFFRRNYERIVSMTRQSE